MVSYVQFSLIVNSVPTQKHVIQSCLTDTQSKEILLEGKKELRSTLDKVKEVFLELNFSETATSLEGIHHYFDTIENVKEEFFKEGVFPGELISQAVLAVSKQLRTAS